MDGGFRGQELTKVLLFSIGILATVGNGLATPDKGRQLDQKYQAEAPDSSARLALAGPANDLEQRRPFVVISTQKRNSPPLRHRDKARDHSRPPRGRRGEMAPARVLVVALSVLGAGCAYLKPHPDSVAQDHYETYGPKFTAEQKAAMPHEELLSKYNDNVRPEEQLVCRRERSVGTHFRKTTCTTRSEREQEKEAAEEFVAANRASFVRLQSTGLSPVIRQVDLRPVDVSPSCHPNPRRP